MAEAIVFLTCPGARLDVIKTTDFFPPFYFGAHFDKL